MRVHVRPPVVRASWLLFILGGFGVGLVHTALAPFRHPWIVSGLALLVGARLLAFERGWLAVVLPALVLASVLSAWALFGPRSYEAAVGRTVRSAWRRVWTYRREWQPMLAVTGLEGNAGSRPPRLVRVDSRPDRDEVLVRMGSGQSVDEWQAASKRLAAVFGVRVVRARRAPHGRDRVLLICRRHDRPLDLEPATGGEPVVERPSPELVVERAPGAFPRTPRGVA